MRDGADGGRPGNTAGPFDRARAGLDQEAGREATKQPGIVAIVEKRFMPAAKRPVGIPDKVGLLIERIIQRGIRRR